MAGRAVEVPTILAILRETPGRLRAAADGASEASLRAATTGGGWSPLELLAHLRSCADVWGDAVATILSQDHPTIRAVNPRTWIESTEYRSVGYAASLGSFVRQRARLSATLEGLGDEG
ncbi:MAG TPA: DinB family protein, partial [Acidimicrobiales bacterium]|nr:DinB family protein [Acidimicrobiales bacterium]